MQTLKRVTFEWLTHASQEKEPVSRALRMYAVTERSLLGHWSANQSAFVCLKKLIQSFRYIVVHSSFFIYSGI